MTRLTKRQAAIIGAYTGITLGPFSGIHEYAEKILNRPIFTHEFSDRQVMEEIKAAAFKDFMDVVFKDDE